MSVQSNSKAKRKIPDSYLDLIRRFPLTSIKVDDQLEQAQQVIDGLLRKGPLDKGEEAYLEVLGDLVAAYEDRHYPIPPASDADLLRHLMEAKGANQADVARDARIARSTVSEILSGKRAFSKSHIGKLASYFHVAPGVFVANL